MNSKIFQVTGPFNGLSVMRGGGLLPPTFSPDCLNVDFKQNEIWSTDGTTKYNATALDEQPTGIYEYRQFDGSIYMMIHTKDKVYKYNTSTDAYDDITGGTLGLTDTDLVSGVTFTDLYIFTDYINNIKQWTGTGNISDLGGSPPKAKYLTVYKNKLVAAYLEIGGNDCPQAIQWSDDGDPETWTDDPMYLVEGNDFITGLTTMGDYLVVFTNRCIHLISHSYGTFPSSHQTIKLDVGCIAPFSIVNLGGKIAYIGEDDIYTFDGGMPVPIGSDTIKDIITNLDGDYSKYSYARLFPEINQAWFAVPYSASTVTYTSGQNNIIICYDYFHNTWTIRDIPAKVFARMYNYTSLTIADLERYGTIGELPGRIGDFAGIGQSFNVYGGYDKYIYNLNSSQQYAGTNYTRYWVSEWMCFDKPDINKTLLRFQPFIHNSLSTDAAISLSIGYDFATTYATTATIDADDSAGGSIIYPNVDLKHTAKWFRVKFSATNQFALQKMRFYYNDKGTK